MTRTYNDRSGCKMQSLAWVILNFLVFWFYMYICVDYRNINFNMVKDEYPLPIIEDHMIKLASARLICTLYLKNGLFHLKVYESSIKYTSFVRIATQYEFLRAPFGLATYPKVFTRFINIIFRDLIAQDIIIMFIDDILVWAKSEEEPVERLRRLLKIAAEYGLYINWDKSQLRRVEYLEPCNRKWWSHRQGKQMLSWCSPSLGLCSNSSNLGLHFYVTKFIQNYA